MPTRYINLLHLSSSSSSSSFLLLFFFSYTGHNESPGRPSPGLLVTLCVLVLTFLQFGMATFALLLSTGLTNHIFELRTRASVLAHTLSTVSLL